MAGEPLEVQDRLEGSEDDDALSLSDFPLATTTHPSSDTDLDHFSDRPHRSSSDFFEFFIDLGSHMRSADDLIVSGKLVPLQDQSAWPSSRGAAMGRRCESLSELERSSVSRSRSSRAQLARSSRSLDYRKLCRPSNSLVGEAERTSSSARSMGRLESIVTKPSRPRWRMLPLGVVKLPAEMELRDMRSRQLRRNPSTLIAPPPPPVVAGVGGNLAVDRGGWKGSWKLIKALSCKDPATVAVATSFACLPHV
ncbi:uncharacterized protein LOC115750790 [Rhodamnia argentea]|uniref:Uncharacterized protein LOC115750790 n=1 Tax=Rhodamnia argentea TaxID=178133 RepID=A0A8B8QAP2_9MYRT|nr:uncharacterized protein LOC115750790 [Rhodamnia argentea]